MESVVPPQITAELTQILSNLVLGDNEIRANAEKAVNERLSTTPELYLLALTQFAITADTEVMRSFSLVLLRRLLFRPTAAPTQSTGQGQPGGSQPLGPSHPQSLAHQHLLTGTSRLSLYDHLSNQTLATLERLLLFSLSHETSASVRKKAVDTICDISNQGMLRGRPWHALQAQSFNMTHAQSAERGQEMAAALRESAYRVFAGCPNLVMDLQTEAVLGVLQRGLQDMESVDVRHAALLASVAYLTQADSAQLAQSISLLSPMLETLPSLASSLSQPPLGSNFSSASGKAKTSNYHYLSTFLSTLTPLCSSHPILFAPHLQSLLTFLPGLILPPVDCGPTPTVGRPFPGFGSSSSSSSSNGNGGGPRQGAFVFPPVGTPTTAVPGQGFDLPSSSNSSSSSSSNSTSNAFPSSSSNGASSEDPDADLDSDTERDERSTLRLSALEFMLSLTEARPSMVRKTVGWTEVLVRACLEGMGEIEDEMDGGGGGGAEWLNDDPSTSSGTADTDSPPALYEQSLDRLACAMGGRSVLPSAFQYIPSMMASYDWRVRHAGLMAIAAIGEGTGKVMVRELDKVVDLVTPMFGDSHPRVRYAACQCIGQLCTDLEEIIQKRFHQKLFSVLIPALDDPEPRVHAHAAAALINFCEGVERETLIPYLDPIVERLLKLLNPDGSERVTKRYVQEQAITTLAMVADASEVTFAKHYPTIMPLLLNVLRNADGATENQKLRVKAMECAGLIAIAVGPEVFRPDSKVLVELLMRIQQSPLDPNDTQLSHYLIATWAKVCQAMGHEFEPYLPIVMPSLLATAAAKADLSVYDEEDDKSEEKEGWETIVMDGQTYGVRTAVMDEKCQAFETLVIYCSTLGPRFAPYLAQTLEVTLSCLKFYFHEGVREACAMLIPMLLSCGKQSSTLTTQMVSATFHQLIHCISTEHDSTFLASLYKYLSESLLVIGGPSALDPSFHTGILDATKRQLSTLAEKRKTRASRAAAQSASNGGIGALGELEKEDLALIEEIEDFALEDMAKMLVAFDKNHPLLVAVSSVRDLGFNTYDSDEDGLDEEEG